MRKAFNKPHKLLFLLDKESQGGKQAYKRVKNKIFVEDYDEDDRLQNESHYIRHGGVNDRKPVAPINH